MSQNYPQQQYPHGYDDSYLYENYPSGQHFAQNDMSYPAQDNFMPPFWAMNQYQLYPQLPAIAGHSMASHQIPSMSATNPAIPGLSLLSNQHSNSQQLLLNSPRANNLNKKKKDKAAGLSEYEAHGTSATKSVPTARKIQPTVKNLTPKQPPPTKGAVKSTAKSTADPNKQPANTSTPSSKPAVPKTPTVSKPDPARPRYVSKSDIQHYRQAASTFVSLLLANNISLADVQEDPSWSNADKRKISKLFNAVTGKHVAVPDFNLVPVPPENENILEASKLTASHPKGNNATTEGTNISKNQPNAASVSDPNSSIRLNGEATQPYSTNAASSDNSSRVDYLAKLRALKSKIAKPTEPKATRPISLKSSPDNSNTHADVVSISSDDIPSPSLETKTQAATTVFPPEGVPIQDNTTQTMVSLDERRRMQTERARQKLLALSKAKPWTPSSIETDGASAAATSAQNSSTETTNSDSHVPTSAPQDSAVKELAPSLNTSGSKRSSGGEVLDDEPSLKRRSTSGAHTPSTLLPEPFIIEASDDSEDEDSEDEIGQSNSFLPVSTASSNFNFPQSRSGSSQQTRIEPLKEMELKIAQLKREIKKRESESCTAKNPISIPESTPALTSEPVISSPLETRHGEAGTIANAPTSPFFTNNQHTNCSSPARLNAVTLHQIEELEGQVRQLENRKKQELQQAEPKGISTDEQKEPSVSFSVDDVSMRDAFESDEPNVAASFISEATSAKRLSPVPEKDPDTSQVAIIDDASKLSPNKPLGSTAKRDESESDSETESNSSSNSDSSSIAGDLETNANSSSRPSSSHSNSNSEKSYSPSVGSHSNSDSASNRQSSVPNSNERSPSVEAGNKSGGDDVDMESEIMSSGSSSELPNARSGNERVVVDDSINGKSRTSPTRSPGPTSNFTNAESGLNSEQPISATSSPTFTPYQSPLRMLKSFRFHSTYLESVAGGYRSLTFSHKLDPNEQICPFDVSGVCTDSNCRKGQHWKQAVLSDEDLILEFIAPDPFWSDGVKASWDTELRKCRLESVREQVNRNLDYLLPSIVQLRSKFIRDPCKAASEG